MVQDGFFGPERKRSNGRPRWRLVSEQLGKELDMSSAYCIPVRSKALKRTVDADKEEWDILDGTPSGKGEMKSTDVPAGDKLMSTGRPIRKQPIRARSAIKPMGGKLAIVKPIIKPSNSEQENDEERVQSSLISATRQPLSPRLRRRHTYSPSKRTCSTPPRASPRWTPKRNADEELAPSRKARRINSSGTRRCALQS